MVDLRLNTLVRYWEAYFTHLKKLRLTSLPPILEIARNGETLVVTMEEASPLHPIDNRNSLWALMEWSKLLDRLHSVGPSPLTLHATGLKNLRITNSGQLRVASFLSFAEIRTISINPRADDLSSLKAGIGECLKCADESQKRVLEAFQRGLDSDDFSFGSATTALERAFASVNSKILPCGHVNAGDICLECEKDGLVKTVAPVEWREAGLGNLFQQGASSPPVTWNSFISLQSLRGFGSGYRAGNLICLPELKGVKTFLHQVNAVKTAVNVMRGRVLFADEVGLGKTVEAGMFMKELLLRAKQQGSSLKSVLVLCPTRSLATQWQMELHSKFGELFLVYGRDINTSLAWSQLRLIATYQDLQETRTFQAILEPRFDIVILDEAHQINLPDNEDVLDIVRRLQKKYFAMLSATPMHESLRELYDLISVLRPGTFPSWEIFEQTYITSSGNIQSIQNAQALGQHLRSGMIRTRRSDATDCQLPKRTVRTIDISLQPQSERVYRQIQRDIAELEELVGNFKFSRLIGKLGEAACSSHAAYRDTFENVCAVAEKRKFGGVYEKKTQILRRLSDANVQTLYEQKLKAFQISLLQLVREEKKTLVFSEFDKTIELLNRKFGEMPELRNKLFYFNPNLPPDQLEIQIQNAQGTEGSVLLCPTDAREGINLQFAHAILNFDLPWNPLWLEQRIGRIQRIGGHPEVLILNFIFKGTIEETIYEYCHNKLKMFEAAVGPVETILGSFSRTETVEDLIREVFVAKGRSNAEAAEAEARLEAADQSAQEKSGTEDGTSKFEDFVSNTFNGINSAVPVGSQNSQTNFEDEEI